MRASNARALSVYAAHGFRRPLRYPRWLLDGVLYELSAAGHIDSRFSDVGGFAALAHQVPYLADLGVTPTSVEQIVPAYLDEMTAKILALNPDFVGFSATFNQVMGSLALAKRLKAARPDLVVIAGGGDSAVDWALALKDIAKVAVVHRRPKFRAAPESEAQLQAAAERGEIEMVVPYQLHALHGADGVLSSVEVATLKGETKQLPADVLLPFFGLSMDLGPIAAWGLEKDGHHVRVDPATCETNIPGVFAIGDVATYPGKLKLILQGFSEAAVAAHAAHTIVHPDQALHFEYSTSKGVPGG